MLNENQKTFFNNNIKATLEYITNSINGNECDLDPKLSRWFRNTHTRYKRTVVNYDPVYAIPDEHMESLKLFFDEIGITEDDFINTSGLKKMVDIIKAKKSITNTSNSNTNGDIEILDIDTNNHINNNSSNVSSDKKIISINDDKTNEENYCLMTLEELQCLLEKYIDETIKLNNKKTSRNIKLYNLLDDDILNIEEVIKKYKVKIKGINEEIKKRKKSDITNNSNDTIYAKSSRNKSSEERIHFLINENCNLIYKVNDLNDTIKSLRKIINELKFYEEQYKKIIKSNKNVKTDNDEIRNLKLKVKKINEDIIKKQAKINELEKLKKQYEAETVKIKDLKNELHNQEKMIRETIKSEVEIKKEIVIQLLISNYDITLEKIKNEFMKYNLSTDDALEIVKSVRCYIPGIINKFDNNGKPCSYTIGRSATSQLDEYRQDNICPQISNVLDGKFSFIVRSDMHLDITSSYDNLIRLFEPYLNFCSNRNNIPILDLGDVIETGCTINDWKKFDRGLINNVYNFYKNYAKAINNAPKISHYSLIGNHDEHPYFGGLDTISILLDNSDNFRLLGVSNGQFKIGDDKIKVFHEKNWQNIIEFRNNNKRDRDLFIYNYLCNEMKNIAKDYIYFLMGHYHFGKINPKEKFAVINNGIDNSLLFTADIKDGKVEKMYVKPLCRYGNKVAAVDYETEIYNRNSVKDEIDSSDKQKKIHL